MPVILALDTTADTCSVAIAGVDGKIREALTRVAREHSQRILPMVEDRLLREGLALGDLDAIAVNRGPGSFTGIRIGLSITQGLAYGVDLPVIGISSLAALANKAFRQQVDWTNKIVVPVIDARMEEVYWSAYRLNATAGPEVLPEPLIEEQVASPSRCASDVLELMRAHKTDDSFVGIGSGWRYPALTALPTVAMDVEYYSSAYDVAELAVAAFGRGDMTSAQEAQPQYLRNEISWQKYQRIRNSKADEQPPNQR